MAEPFQQIIKAILCNQCSMNIVPMPNGKHVRFRHPVRVGIEQTPECKYCCKIGSFAVASADTPQSAYEAAVTALWELIGKMIHSPSHILDEEDVRIKGQLLAAVDLMDTEIIPFPTERNLLCTIFFFEGSAYAAPCQSDFDDLRLAIPKEFMRGLDVYGKELFMIKTSCSRDGYPKEPVLAIERMNKDADEPQD